MSLTDEQARALRIMRAITNGDRWYEAFLDTPFSPPLNAKTEAEAERTPGCHVKSREKTADHWPRYFGRLTSYDVTNDIAIVMSKPPHGDDGKETVWEGTCDQYHQMWECD